MFRPEKARKSSASRKRRASSAFRRNTGRKISFAKHALRRRPFRPGKGPACARETKQVPLPLGIRSKNVSGGGSRHKRRFCGRDGRFRFPAPEEAATPVYLRQTKQVSLPPESPGKFRFPSQDAEKPASRKREAGFCRPLPSAAERCPPREQKRFSGCACCLPTRGRPWAARAGR